jgi:ferredoxin like protein
MTQPKSMKAILGKNVFKPSSREHIVIKPEVPEDRLRRMVFICPAGLYATDEDDHVILSLDGCLECGTCRLVCGTDVLEWDYPAGGSGVQFRFG